jgi:hypothetical protein
MHAWHGNNGKEESGRSSTESEREKEKIFPIIANVKRNVSQWNDKF